VNPCTFSNNQNRNYMDRLPQFGTNPFDSAALYYYYILLYYAVPDIFRNGEFALMLTCHTRFEQSMNREMIVKPILYIVDIYLCISLSSFRSMIIHSSRNQHQQSHSDPRNVFDFPRPVFSISYDLIIDLQIFILMCYIPVEMSVHSFADLYHFHLDLPQT
jgi:hypothetical protein